MSIHDREHGRRFRFSTARFQRVLRLVPGTLRFIEDNHVLSRRKVRVLNSESRKCVNALDERARRARYARTAAKLAVPSGDRRGNDLHERPVAR
ncbi:MAG: hypothetical protein M3436_18550 [Pseudomonadota bacterium]|nr:hypothetical protein [Pseudomonadota bacterium]